MFPEDENKTSQWLEAYKKAFATLMESDIAEYKAKTVYEKAKKLSINQDFLASVTTVREEWHISPHLPIENEKARELSPENVLAHWCFAGEPSEAEWKRLNNDLRNKCCKPFDLDWERDYGLIVVAVCMGLTYENILHHWHKMELTAISNSTLGATLVIHQPEKDLRNLFEVTLAIAYLSNELARYGYPINSLPEAILEWVKPSFELCKSIKLGEFKGLNPAKANIVIDRLREYRQNVFSDEVHLYIRVRSDTTLADVKRVWPQVELRKLKLWGIPPKRSRTWNTYERDVELTLLYDHLGDYEAVIKEYDKRHPDKPIAHYNKIGQITISDDVYDLVRQAIKRTKDRMTTDLEP